MPHAAFTLAGGADTNQTYALNQAGLSLTQLIRYMPDESGKLLVQKLGGWQKLLTFSFTYKIVNLWAWQDLNANAYLAVGVTNSFAAIIIKTGQYFDISARMLVNNNTPNFSTVNMSNVVTIVDTGSDQSTFNYVFFKTPVAIGTSGIVVYGIYPIYQVLDVNTYTIQVATTATATVNNLGTVPDFSTTSGSYSVKVTMNAHGLLVGSTFSVLVSTVVGGITLYGTYTVATVIDANNFTIEASTAANATTSGFENGGNVNEAYYIGIGPPITGGGYGAGAYGSGGYGKGSTLTPTTGSTLNVTDWSIDNFGQILVACPPGGAIYYWQSNNSIQNLQIVSQNSPIVNDGIFVAMPQRQIVAWGSTVTGISDPLLIRWCDVQDFTIWTALSTNQAGQFRIPRGSKIIGGIQTSQQGLIWTDLAVWSMQYIGQPFVYSFNEIGNGCGLISRKAMGTNNNVTYWMSQNQFFELSGNGLQPLICPIWDVIYQQIDKNYTDSIRCAVNSMFNEVSWFYPTIGSNGVNTNYVKYNYLMKQWDFGTLGRTAWLNQSVLGAPIGAGPDSYVYQHETTNDADTQAMASSFKTGYFAISEADIKVFIDQIWPDMKFGLYNSVQNANVSITFYTVDYPGQTPNVYGPFSFTNSSTFLTPRFRGRLISIKINSSDFGSFWRIGNIRYRWQPDGKY